MRLKCLKHFNRICPASHPNLLTFAHAICQEANRIVQQMDDVAKGREAPPDYSDPVFPKIPPEFYNDNKKQSAKEGPRKGCNKRVRNELMCSSFTQCLFCEIMCSQTKVPCRILCQ